MYCDNQAMIQIAHDSGHTGRSKPIELRFFAIQDVVTRRDTDLKYCSSEENCADILTKSLFPQTHAKGASLLNLAAPQ